LQKYLTGDLIKTRTCIFRAFTAKSIQHHWYATQLGFANFESETETQ